MAFEKRAQGPEHFVDDVVVEESEPHGDGHASDYLGDALAEAYADGRRNLHVHFRANHIESGVAGDWCAAFNRASKQELDIVDAQVLGDEERLTHPREKDDVGQPVLVLDIKPVELPKGVSAEPVASVVRLQYLDDCLGSWVDPPKHAIEFFKGIFATRAKDGKLRVALDALGNPPAFVDDGEFEDKVVERGAQVVDTIANDQAKVGGRLANRLKPRELVAGVNVECRPGSVRVFVGPESDFRFEAVQVVDGPTESSLVVERHGW